MAGAVEPDSAHPTGPGAILELVRSGQAVTRAQLMAATGLSRTTMAGRLDLLTASELLEETEVASDATVGRPAGSFRIRPGSGVLLAADIGGSHLRTAVTDMACRVLQRQARDIDVADGPDDVLGQVARDFGELLDRAGERPERVRATGVGVPGPVEAGTGRVVSPPIMTGWEDYDVPEFFTDRFPGTVRVDKDTNVMALGEHRTHWPDHRHLLFVKAGTGIGSGIVLDGRLHHGAGGAAGDIGHIPAPGMDETAADVPLCRCGQFGCLEAVAGGWALVRELSDADAAPRSTDEVAELVRAGDPRAVRQLRTVARLLGQAVADTVSLLNPSLVVVGGELALAKDHVLAGVREVTYRRSLPLATRDLRVVASALRDSAGVVGAAQMAADAVFAPAAVERVLGGG